MDELARSLASLAALSDKLSSLAEQDEDEERQPLPEADAPYLDLQLKALAALDARLDEVGYQCSALDSSGGVKALDTLVTGLPFCHRRAAPLGG